MMSTSEVMPSVLSLLAGGVLGAAFFLGLWWTVDRLAAASQPGLLVLASMLGRTGLVLGGFYLVAGGSWQRLLLCMAGFVIARLVVTRFLTDHGSVTVKSNAP